ncbi:protein of unknown function DUF222 [Mycolicibacterium chubuense NBB4]|uniref:DUF222 domain-containing protein n=1 Tax=Mycolicibacterium chubuense (strain NBB4) TaxID=710421 RepID=I4BHL8_MYCCN|nr:HNH endonuclease signature motif containing protein [Mycolicibacterium chubuense]AFM16775.1 protein of unknown function DUF222 [Mycolicibacterium chubuense NBB4]
MFDRLFADVADDALVAAIEQAARDEARAGARRLAAIAELVHRSVDDSDEQARWKFDSWDNTAAQVAAALTMSQRRASGQLHIAVALRERLPRVAALYCQGRLSFRLISELTWRTHLVDDGRLMTLIDDALAAKAEAWGTLSETQLVRAVDAIIERYDPEAVRLAKELLRTRDFKIGASQDKAETTTAWGLLMAADAIVLERRITAIVKTVCDNDPRSIGERRSDAMGAVAHGNDHLVCRCGSTDCPKAGATAPASHIVIRVIADQAAIDAAHQEIAATEPPNEPEQPGTTNNKAVEDETDDKPPNEPEQPGTTNNKAVEDETDDKPPNEPADDEAQPPKDTGLALLPGGKIVPTAVLAEAIRNGAKIVPLQLPGPECEAGYRPSAALAEFVRIRDMFCRFPGCSVPADRCDLDHSLPWPYGPTHPSNLTCKCRGHHLMKTFWDGPGGWSEKQSPDGTVTWTSPSGRAYVTKPGSHLFFPTLNTAAADLPPPPPIPPPRPARAVKIPKRRRLRSAEVAARIKAERARGPERAV